MSIPRSAAAILAAAALASAAHAQADKPFFQGPPPKLADLPEVDGLDPRACQVKDGWMVVDVHFSWFLNQSDEAGRLDSDTVVKVAAWKISLENFLIETADTVSYCNRLIAKRREIGF